MSRRPRKAKLNMASGASVSLYGGLRRLGLGLVLVLVLAVVAMKVSSGGPSGGEESTVVEGSSSVDLHVTTWNIAAINNNPFEYWLTYDDPSYVQLMDAVQAFVTSADSGTTVAQVFTPDMYQQLRLRMQGMGWSEEDLQQVDQQWTEDYSGRTLIDGFLRDDLIGLKRLTSMPDRVTNTVFKAEGGADYRPTVINCYQGRLESVADWWTKWQAYMFEQPSDYANKLLPISRAKYPKLTELEEKISLPLQTLTLAIFDAILVNLMEEVTPSDVDWQNIRSEICDNLNLKKNENLINILMTQYYAADIMFLQEVAGSFIAEAKKETEGHLGRRYHVIAPASMDPKRDQNSVVLLKKTRFSAAYEEVTDKVTAQFPEGVKVPVAPGDILSALAVDRVTNQKLMLSSFHGDTNGLASIPVVTAVKAAFDAIQNESENPPDRLIFGLDANTYRVPKPGCQYVLEFADAYAELGLTSCFGDRPNPEYVTTYNARTFLQPQLNKAVKRSETAELGDVNPKDFVLFGQDHFKPLAYEKDNTGMGRYIEDMVFPTLKFPSDHGVLSAVLKYISDE